MGMTDRDRKLLAVFAVVILLGGYWFLILGKKRAAVAEAETAKSTAQQTLDAAKQAQASGAREKKRYPVSYSRVIRLGKAIPGDADYASLVVQVSDIADQSGVAFDSLTSTEGATAGGATGVTGLVTTCGEGGSTGASAAATAPGPSGPSGPTGATQANSGVGQAINNANAASGAASGSANAAAGASADTKKCAAAPTLTDLAAVQAGLALRTYSFKFTGSFFKLHDVMHRLLRMVTVRNGKVKVTGRLLQINTIALTSSDFPDLSADVQMTGYSLPSNTSLTAGASAVGPAGSPAPAAAPGPAPAGGAQ